MSSRVKWYRTPLRRIQVYILITNRLKASKLINDKIPTKFLIHKAFPYRISDIIWTKRFNLYPKRTSCLIYGQNVYPLRRNACTLISCPVTLINFHQGEHCLRHWPLNCAGNSTVTGELSSQRPVARSFDVFFHLHLNKRLSKQSWRWWSETPLWRHCNKW